MAKRWTTDDLSKISKKKDPKISANALTQQALRMLRLKGFNCWRQNNGGVYDPVKKVFRRNSSTPGVSDILGYHRTSGKFIACEIKAGKDVLSDEQKEFLKDVKAASGFAIVIRTIDDLVDLENLL